MLYTVWRKKENLTRRLDEFCKLSSLYQTAVRCFTAPLYYKTVRRAYRKHLHMTYGVWCLEGQHREMKYCSMKTADGGIGAVGWACTLNARMGGEHTGAAQGEWGGCECERRGCGIPLLGTRCRGARILSVAQFAATGRQRRTRTDATSGHSFLLTLRLLSYIRRTASDEGEQMAIIGVVTRAVLTSPHS